MSEGEPRGFQKRKNQRDMGQENGKGGRNPKALIPTLKQRRFRKGKGFRSLAVGQAEFGSSHVAHWVIPYPSCPLNPLKAKISFSK